MPHSACLLGSKLFRNVFAKVGGRSAGLLSAARKVALRGTPRRKALTVTHISNRSATALSSIDERSDKSLKFRPLSTDSLVFREEHEVPDWQYKLKMPGQKSLTGTRVL
jgi:hypothetical protein